MSKYHVATAEELYKLHRRGVTGGLIRDPVTYLCPVGPEWFHQAMYITPQYCVYLTILKTGRTKLKTGKRSGSEDTLAASKRKVAYSR